MNYVFRDAVEGDLPVIKDIYDWYIAHSTATFHTDPIHIDQLKEFVYIGHPVYRTFIILKGDDPQGYCFLTYYKKRQAYDRTAEVTIYLRHDCCGKGLGMTALSHLETAAKAGGLRNLIGIVTGDNIASIALFEKAGYLKCAHFKNVGEKFNTVLDVVGFQKEL